MSPIKISALVAPLAAIATLASLFFFHSSRAREAGSLRYENDRLRRSAYERLHPARALVDSSSTAPASVGANLGTDSPPLNAPTLYRDEGNATPLAALQSFAWACDRGDATTVARLLYFDPAARRKAESYLASLPAEARSRWKSVDQMAATLLTGDNMEHPFPAAEILATATTEFISPERVVVRLPGTPKDRLEYQRTSAGWCYAITESAVDAYLARSATAPQPRAH